MQHQAKNLFTAVGAQLGLIKWDSQHLSAIPLAQRLKVALLLQKLWLKHGMQKPTQKYDPVHLHQDASPLKRLGLQPENLLSALNSFDTVVDISEQDLDRLYHRAQLNASQRKSGEIRCSDIMSSDLITVGPNSDIASAWQLLRKHKISILPVIDTEQQ